jgi:hypothetical protein
MAEQDATRLNGAAIVDEEFFAAHEHRARICA